MSHLAAPPPWAPRLELPSAKPHQLAGRDARELLSYCPQSPVQPTRESPRQPSRRLRPSDGAARSGSGAPSEPPLRGYLAQALLSPRTPEASRALASVGASVVRPVRPYEASLVSNGVVQPSPRSAVDTRQVWGQVQQWGDNPSRLVEAVPRRHPGAPPHDNAGFLEEPVQTPRPIRYQLKDEEALNKPRPVPSARSSVRHAARHAEQRGAPVVVTPRAGLRGERPRPTRPWEQLEPWDCSRAIQEYGNVHTAMDLVRGAGVPTRDELRVLEMYRQYGVQAATPRAPLPYTETAEAAGCPAVLVPEIRAIHPPKR